MDVPEPKTKTELLLFLGLAQYLHRFIPQMHHNLHVLTPLTGSNKPKIVNFNAKQREAFNNLKKEINNVDHMMHPELSKEFHIFTDASKYGIGGMLAQYDKNGVMRPVSYCSKIFSQTQQNWHVSEQELYAVIYAVEKWQRLLRYNKFQIHTDHRNLEQLFKKALDFKSGKLFRWAVRLQDFHFECKYIKGKDNVIADWLSRESVYLQHPQYDKIKQFYDCNPNPIRYRHSNNGGVDIMKLYLHHLHLSILNNGTNGHYFSTNNQYAILQYQEPIETKSDILSMETHKFLNVSKTDINKLENIRNCYPLRMPEPGESIDSISSISSEMPEPYDSIAELDDIETPPPYIQPKDDPKPKPPTTRYSKRIFDKTIPKPRHKPLVINDVEHTDGKYLKDKTLYAERQKLRDMHKRLNQQIIDNKPYEVAYCCKKNRFQEKIVSI